MVESSPQRRGGYGVAAVITAAAVSVGVGVASPSAAEGSAALAERVAGAATAVSGAGPGGWHGPVTLSARPKDILYPAVAMDPRGDALAVWNSEDGLTASTQRGGGAWSKPRRVARRPGQWLPVVAMAGNGDAAAARMTSRGIQVVRRLAGRPWRHPWTIPRSKTGVLYDMAMAGRGDISVVWRRRGRHHILVTQLRIGQGWTKSAAVGELWRVVAPPHVAMDARGDATVAWIGRAHETSPRRVRAVRRPAHGRWTTPRILTTTDLEGGEDVAPAYVAMNPRGDTSVAWTAWPEPDTGGFAQAARRPAGGRWQTPARLSPEGRDGGVYVNGVVMDHRGDTSVSWLTWSDSQDLETIAVAQRPAHGSWQPATVVSPAGAHPDRQTPVLAMGAHGAVTVAWYDQDVTAQDLPPAKIQAAHRPAAGPWQPTQTLETGYGVGWQIGLAAGAAGRAVATWTWAGSHGAYVHAAWR